MHVLLKKKASEIKTLASNYGGIYIFDKKIREEILELEKEEFRSKYLGSEIKVGNETHFVNFSYLKKKFPKSFLMVVNIIVMIIIIK
ncbi:hypothetical protein K4E85_05125 [Campylobacter coli]